MRLPWGKFSDMRNLFLKEIDYVTLGCISFEERCKFVPSELGVYLHNGNPNTFLLKIHDPIGCTPDYSIKSNERVNQNENTLRSNGLQFIGHDCQLLASEDELLNIMNSFKNQFEAKTVIMDISSLPKRYFCFFVKRFIKDTSVHNLLITYTQPMPSGYIPESEHLAEDPEIGAELPGHLGKLSYDNSTRMIIVAMGFEEFNIESILEAHKGKSKDRIVKVIISFPPNGEYVRRQWKVLRRLFEDRLLPLSSEISVISTLDVEQVYFVMDRWEKYSDIVLLPFGPKTHSLAMCLYATKYDVRMSYTQPKAYNPDYTIGIGESWLYVVKWDGICCYDRILNSI